MVRDVAYALLFGVIIAVVAQVFVWAWEAL